MGRYGLNYDGKSVYFTPDDEWRVERCLADIDGWMVLHRLPETNQNCIDWDWVTTRTTLRDAAAFILGASS